MCCLCPGPAECVAASLTVHAVRVLQHGPKPGASCVGPLADPAPCCLERARTGWEGFEPAELLCLVEAFPEGKALLAPPSHHSPPFCSRFFGCLSPFPTAEAVCASPLAGGAMVVMCTLLTSSSLLGFRSLSIPSLWNAPSCTAVWLLLPVCLYCHVSPVVPHIFWKLVSPAHAVAQGPKPFHAHPRYSAAVSGVCGWASINSTARSHPL